MKLKFIAAAAVLAVSGGANAAIDVGLDGSGDFFFNIWDTNSSYTLDLNLQQSDFVSGLAASGGYSFTQALGADALFTSFIANANQSALQWNLVAVETQGVRTVHQTINGALPATAITNGNGRSMAGVAVGAFALNNINPSLPAGVNSAVFTSAQPGYTGNPSNAGFGCRFATFQNFNTCGTLANNSAETGLGMAVNTFAATGPLTSLGTVASVFDSGNAVKVYIDSSYNLQIAAVPEPETYAMLLAGLGLMGAIARRRQNKA